MKKAINLLYINIVLFCNLVGKPIPQPGENIWYLAARIGTALDQIAVDSSLCCNSTFTVIESTANTLSSKIDLLDANVQDCCTILDSKVDSVQLQLSLCCSSIDTALTRLDGTPLIIPPTGTTITTPGYYCLAADVTLLAGSFVATNTSDVVLDLNQHTITAGEGLSVLAGNNRVTIQNGFIVSSATNGLILTGTNENITLKNLEISSSPNGISCTNQSNLLISNINISDVSNGILPTTCNNTIIQDCNIIGKIDSTSLIGLSFNAGGITAPNNCILINRVKVDTFAIGFNFLNISSLQANDCIACNNWRTGATDAGFIITDTDTTLPQKHILRRCTSQVNASNGFLISQGGSSAAYILVNCAAMGNSTLNTGAGNGFTTTRTNGTFINCISSGMSVGFNCDGGNNNFTGCSAENSSTVGMNVISTKNYFLGCNCNKNGSNGFGSVNTNNVFENCISDNNAANGFSASTAASSNSFVRCVACSDATTGIAVIGNANLITNCMANVNTIGFGSLTLPAGSSTIFQNCTAEGNTTFGFQGSSTNTAVYYLNTANANGTTAGTDNFNTVASPNSAPTSGITSVTRRYGDNLRGI